MGGLSKIGKQKEEEILSERIRSKAAKAMEGSDFSEVLELIGAKESKEVAAALRITMADKLSEYTIRSARIARRRGGKISASAVIMAAGEQE
ncbi:MAG: hypothetical protein M1360_03840 [Candidatus Marsarchaeota archaeon]|jgi:hypothetical protein|nr:hypothetical protein [Candidatus Marsarchaeota archaeon]MCL5419042.1 hypothetical protein [Candidatus Marsarchaeota archaeon]